MDELEFVMDEFSKQLFFAIYQSAGFTFQGPSGLSDQFTVSIQGTSKPPVAISHNTQSLRHFMEVVGYITGGLSLIEHAERKDMHMVLGPLEWSEAQLQLEGGIYESAISLLVSVLE